jgi:hypothetical protein
MAAPRTITDKRTINKIVSHYRKGASLAVLADEHSVAITTIRNYLLREGVELRKRGRRKKA